MVHRKKKRKKLKNPGILIETSSVLIVTVITIRTETGMLVREIANVIIPIEELAGEQNQVAIQAPLKNLTRTPQLVLIRQTLMHQIVIPGIPAHPGVEDEVVADAPGASAKMQIQM